MTKHMRWFLRQYLLSQDKCMNEYNLKSIVNTFIDFPFIGKATPRNERVEFALDAIAETYDESDLLAYMKMIHSGVFMSIREYLGALERNYFKRLGIDPHKYDIASKELNELNDRVNARALTDNPEGMNRA